MIRKLFKYCLYNYYDKLQNRSKVASIYYKLSKETLCEIIKISQHSIWAKVTYKDVIHVKKINIRKEKINVIDYCNKSFTYPSQSTKVCRGYGNQEEHSNA